MIYHILLPSIQNQLYTEWDLRADYKRKIMFNSTYAYLLDEFGVPKNTLRKTLNILFPPLKCTNMKYLWGLIAIRDVNKGRVREMNRLTTTKIVRAAYLLI